MVTARYKWEIGTLTKGFAIHRKNLPAAKYVPIIAIIFICWGAYDTLTAERWVVGAAPLVFGAVLLLGARPLAFWQFRRAVRRSSSYGTEMTYAFDPDQIVISGEGHHTTFIWKKLYSATVSDHGILLYAQKTLFHWIPVSAFSSPSDIATIRSYLEQNGVRIQTA